MTLAEILHGSAYSLELFTTLYDNSIQRLEERIKVKTNKKGVAEPFVTCIVRDKEIKLTPEEVVRQLYAERLMNEYGYPKERLVFEYPVYFGRETKRADIVIKDKDDPTVAYIIVEVKKPKAKDGRDQLKSYTHATGASMAVWTNGTSITYYHRKNPNYFEDIKAIPSNTQTLADVLQQPFTMQNLWDCDKLTKTGKSLKDLILEMEDEVLANAGVDVFEEVFKLIFAKLYDEQIGATDKEYNLEFRNSGQTDIQLKEKIEKLFKRACGKWTGVFPEDAKINLTPPHLSICVSSLETVKLFNSNLDVVDEAFEYLMSKSSKGEKGQYFTPRYVIDMCVKMLNPQVNEKMIDTAAGSSGFPVHTIFHVWKQMQLKAGKAVSHLFTATRKSNDELEYVQDNVFAIDFDEKAVRVARTLNLIAGDGHTNVMHLNTLDYGRWGTVTKEETWNDTYNDGFKKLKKLNPEKDFATFNFDIVMANPPFAGEVKEGQILNRYELGLKNGKIQKSVSRDILFIERNLNFLKPGGRMAIVLPQGRFNNSTDKYIRDFIAERCRILAVVGLHGNTFKPHTGTKTSVLFVQKWDDELCPKVDNYNIFFATQRLEGKNNSGDKLYWTEDKTGTTTDPKLAKRDIYGHPIVYHDLFATVDYDCDNGKLNELVQQTPDGIAEAFIEFAKKEKLSFFSMSPVFNEAKYRALLEKLEVSILTYAEMCKNNNTYRWDSEYFLKTYLAADILIRNRNVIQLNSIASIKGGKRLPLFATFSPQGSPYIRAEDVKNNFIHWEESPKISFEVYQLIKQYQLKYNDLLLTIVGNSIGDVGICKFAISPCNFTENCVKITDNNISEYLFAFLLSRYGQIQIAREQVGTAQPKLAIERIRTFLIPQFDQQFYKAIKAVIDNARKKEEASIDCYKKSENELLAELNLTDWQPDDESVATKTFADFQNSGRLDAEYYQPKYDEYLAKVKSYSGGISTVANHFEQNKTTVTFSLPRYNYIEIGDINVGNGEASFNLVQTEELPANAKYVIQQGDILISKVRPYRGAVAIIDFEPQDVIASGAFTILRENGAIRKEVLSTLLRIPLYKDWLLKWNVGSSYPVIKDEDILNLTIPVIKQEIQDQIAEKVQESFALRKESKRLLDLAKHAVEVAIEQGEDAAMKLLTDAVNN